MKLICKIVRKMSRIQYYAVKVGRNPGVYITWNECKEQVTGYSGAIFKKFSNIKDALNFAETTETKKEENLCENNLFHCKNVIYVDGAFNNTTRPYGYGSVVDCKGKDLIKHHKFLLNDMELEKVILPVGKRRIIKAFFEEVEHQNNGAELLAAIAGMRIVLYMSKFEEYEPINTIYCDSSIIVDSWSNKMSKTVTGDKAKYIAELIRLKKKLLKINCRLMKISGDDNLADLGFHVKK